MILFLSNLVKKQYGLPLFRQISYEMVSNAHVCQLTVSLFEGCHHEFK